LEFVKYRTKLPMHWLHKVARFVCSVYYHKNEILTMLNNW